MIGKFVFLYYYRLFWFPIHAEFLQIHHFWYIFFQYIFRFFGSRPVLLRILWSRHVQSCVPNKLLLTYFSSPYLSIRAFQLWYFYHFFRFFVYDLREPNSPNSMRIIANRLSNFSFSSIRLSDWKKIPEMLLLTSHWFRPVDWKFLGKVCYC